MSAPVTEVVPVSLPTAEYAEKARGSAKIWLGGIVVGLYVLIAIAAPWLRPDNPLTQDLVNALQGPSGHHLLGTDELGRDVLSRLMSAARLDLTIAVLATVFPCLVGTAIGVLCGYVGGWVDAIAMRIADLLQAFPTYILMIVLVFSLGPGVRSLLISFTVVGWVVYARLIRGQVLSIRRSEYVTAAITGGLSTPRIIVRHVLPNALKQTLVYLTSDMVFAVTALAAFSFLGFGIQQPTAEWGTMIASAQPYIATAPRLTVVPGLVITVFAFGLAILGDGLQERLERR